MAASSGHADSGSNESNAKSDRPAQVLIAARYRDQSRQPPQPAALPAKKKKKKRKTNRSISQGKKEKNASPHCSGGTCPARRRMAAEANPRSRSHSSRTMRLPYWTASGKHHHLAEIHRQHTGPALMIPTTSSVTEAIRQQWTWISGPGQQGSGSWCLNGYRQGHHHQSHGASGDHEAQTSRRHRIGGATRRQDRALHQNQKQQQAGGATRRQDRRAPRRISAQFAARF